MRIRSIARLPLISKSSAKADKNLPCSLARDVVLERGTVPAVMPRKCALRSALSGFFGAAAFAALASAFALERANNFSCGSPKRYGSFTTSKELDFNSRYILLGH